MFFSETFTWNIDWNATLRYFILPLSIYVIAILPIYVTMIKTHTALMQSGTFCVKSFTGK